MYTRPHRTNSRMAVVLFALASLIATSFSAVLVWGPTLTPVLVVAALAASGALLAGLARLRELIREWRWNAGHRLH
ncbi:hypothetical protein [Caenimonas koreensis]|uniref:Uncharacterized protein n=1 Tax=Caenimonas koreensis DSM 17982 TaxID=1121255 RepID=A0A844B299_9BURK|nr:hypothetical protein [Caenimonas koreensis]MRD48848.1 hypothetical protein [Caenimonas koreensis DSM 17982]